MVKNEGGNSDFKLYLINWDIVSTRKRIGALLLGGILSRNVALLGKRLWKFSKEQSFVWATVTRSKCGHGKDG